MKDGKALAAEMDQLKAQLLEGGIAESIAREIAFNVVELRDECERTHEFILKLERIRTTPLSSDEWIVLHSHISHLCGHGRIALTEIEKIW